MKLNKHKLKIATVCAGMDFQTLSKKTGLSVATFHITPKTAYTRLSTLSAICEALKCDVTDIVDDMEG